MGFDRELRAIVQSLPTARQTLLFSATLTKSVRALAQLSLKSPEYPPPPPLPSFVSTASARVLNLAAHASCRYCGVHDAAAACTPSRLSQHYMVVEASEYPHVLLSCRHFSSSILFCLATAAAQEVGYTMELHQIASQEQMRCVYVQLQTG
jgi:superfamily II DNA/RNA helicase